MPSPDASNLDTVTLAAQRDANRLARIFRLALRPPRNAAVGGNWLGTGIGSSIDFQDHRPYLPGDDPRYINWQAYARTGSYTMKLYRDETSPLLDLVIDVSRSIMADGSKARAALTLFYLCREQALTMGAALQCYATRPASARKLSADELAAGSWLEMDAEGSCSQLAPDFGSIPWRKNAIRLVISDFLYPGDPRVLMGSFFRGATWGAGLRVFVDAEASPVWQGGTKLYDHETGMEETVYCDRDFLDEYRSAYRSHFALWEEQMRRFGFGWAGFAGEVSLREQLTTEGVRSGVFSA